MASKRKLERQLTALTQSFEEIQKGFSSGAMSTAAEPSSQLLYAFGGGYASNTGTVVTPYQSLQSSAVYACVNVISSDIAKLPLRLKKRVDKDGKDGWKDMPDHEIMQLLNRPNPWMTYFDFWEFVVTSQQLRGNAFIYIRRRNGKPYQLIPIIPDNVNITLSKESGLLYYDFTHMILTGQTELISCTQEDMIHIKNKTLNGGFYGLSPIACSQDVIGLALSTQKHAATVFKNGALIRGMLTHPGRLNKEVASNLRQQFTDAYGGQDNAHKTVVLEENMKFEGVSMTAIDAQLIESRKFSVEEICRIFRVPPHKLASLDRATFSNIENQNQQFIDDCLMTICRKIEEALEAKLLDNQPRTYKLRFDFDALLRGDLKTRMEAYQIGLMNGIYNQNEVRERENMEPIEGGDQYRVPLNQGSITDPPGVDMKAPDSGPVTQPKD